MREEAANFRLPNFAYDIVPAGLTPGGLSIEEREVDLGHGAQEQPLCLDYKVETGYTKLFNLYQAQESITSAPFHSLVALGQRS